ncbi:PREDICTED: disintegrin and metalloproteinase domain-containing protein 20-like [Ceratotherium simum simum]|uniref:Disintegrin and metalloproteinase domain-containing protein 20-like n=1 Tax=Ceratotherium simum simum TaxID=73337 RepID=A0ABM0HTG3_CERSS|nr:PREDICTED: disintegrin and metalloproteinase domain-containing protein 20-like [Ceratotherium simum simum]
MAECGGSMMADSEALVHARITLLLLWLRVFLFLSAWSQVGLSQRHGPPEVVIPLKVTGTSVGMNPLGWLSYSLHFGGHRHIVHMKVTKHFLSRHLPVFTYTDQGALLEDQPFVQNDCYYHGYVEGDPESLVSLNTCFGGFQGILQTNDIVYKIKPQRLSTTFEHLVYMMGSEETESPPIRCGLTNEEIARQLKFQESDNSTLMQTTYEGWWIHRRYLEYVSVIDNSQYTHRRRNVSLVQQDVCTIVHLMDSIYDQLGMDVILVGIDIWTNEDHIALSDVRSTLDTFCPWKSENLNTRLPHDATQLFSRAAHGGTGFSHVETICSGTLDCGVVAFRTDDIQYFATMAAHELGHLLGMHHDDTTCKCGFTNCLMADTQTVTPKFSNCSYNRFFGVVAYRRCMEFSPNPDRFFAQKRCGNSVVEAGEKCDCGSLALCAKDPCCDSNCTLSRGAACAFGLCCRDCTYMPSGTMCRKEENECDLPEWCNGTSSECPEDVYVQDGLPCKGGGHCYEKRCNNRDEQCRKLFGKLSRSGPQSCYQQVNTRGDRFGNCGITAYSYTRCNISDALCGRVQCEYVAGIPTLKDHSTLLSSHINGITCWGTDYHLGITTPDVGEVKDGTDCGTDHICIRRKCVHISHLDSQCTPRFCNLKGVCNNRHHCHCNVEWEPPTCREEGSGGSLDSGPPPQRKYKYSANDTSPLPDGFLPSGGAQELLEGGSGRRHLFLPVLAAPVTIILTMALSPVSGNWFQQ